MEGYNKAIELLHKASTSRGFVAAVQEEDNYRRVWARDSALCALAALSSGDEKLIATSRQSIETIFINQHKHGFIPSNVNPVNNHVSYGNAVGRVDNHAWIIISACTYAHVAHEEKWLQQFESHISKCFGLMDAWEFNGRGLMYVPQSADWADEYYHHGYILYNQLLRLWALRVAAKFFPNQDYGAEAARILAAVETYFGGKKHYAVQVERMWQPDTKPYWIMGFNTFAIYTQFDLQANALAVLLGLGDQAKNEALMNYVTNEKHDSLIPSFYPAVEDEDNRMTELKSNYAYRFRNLTGEFHNGGLWPVWNGFASMCFSQANNELAESLSLRINEICRSGDWEFNECYHGTTREAIGVPHCAWSAAGLILSKNRDFMAKLIV